MTKTTQCLVATLVTAFGLGAAHAQDRQTLYVFNWSQYMDPEIIEAFEEQYNARVVENFYNSLPEMFSKLRAGGDSQYDIIVPSNYFVPRLVESGMVQPLDHSKLPNLSNLGERFIDPEFDPGNEYTVAYQWGTTGLIYNSALIPDAPNSWSILFDENINADHPFAVISDGQVSMAAACAYLGHDFQCTDHEQWQEAARLMLATKQRRNFSSFSDGTPQLQQIAQGVIQAGMTYNGDYVFFALEDPEDYENVEFIIPDEGAELWVDNMMIPARAPNPDLAHQFINFILDAEIGAQLSNWTYYTSPNAAAQSMLDEILLEAPSTPTDAEMERVHFLPSLSGQDLQVFQQLWQEVQQR